MDDLQELLIDVMPQTDRAKRMRTLITYAIMSMFLCSIARMVFLVDFWGAFNEVIPAFIGVFLLYDSPTFNTCYSLLDFTIIGACLGPSIGIRSAWLFLFFTLISGLTSFGLLFHLYLVFDKPFTSILQYLAVGVTLISGIANITGSVAVYYLFQETSFNSSVLGDEPRTTTQVNTEEPFTGQAYHLA